MDAEPLTKIVSESELASGRRETESKPRSVSGWAEMWSGITYGLALVGLYSLGKLFWPENDPIQWLFMLVTVAIWIVGCRFSGLLPERYDFPDGKYADLKRFVAGGIGFFALWTVVYVRDVRPRFSFGSFLAWALVFVVGGVARLGSRPSRT